MIQDLIINREAAVVQERYHEQTIFTQTTTNSTDLGRIGIGKNFISSLTSSWPYFPHPGRLRNS